VQKIEGALRTRRMDRPVHDPVEAGNSLAAASWEQSCMQTMLFEGGPTDILFAEGGESRQSLLC